MMLNVSARRRGNRINGNQKDRARIIAVSRHLAYPLPPRHRRRTRQWTRPRNPMSPVCSNAFEAPPKIITIQLRCRHRGLSHDHASSVLARSWVPTFALGCARIRGRDEFWGPRVPFPAVQATPELAWHIAQSCRCCMNSASIVNRNGCRPRF